jgi:hypothetical protein
MGAVPKAADKFRTKATVRPPRQEYRQGDQQNNKAEKVLSVKETNETTREKGTTTATRHQQLETRQPATHLKRFLEQSG